MTKTVPRSWIVTLVAVLAFGVFASAAHAQSVNSDSWPSDDVDDNGVVTLYGYGDADSGGQPGRVGLALTIFDPNWQALAVQGAHSIDGFASAQTSIGLADGCLEGLYHVEAAGDMDGNHYDCFALPVDIHSTVSAPYQLSDLDGSFAYYNSCQGGIACSRVHIGKSRIAPTSGPFPSFAQINSFRFQIDAGVFHAAWCVAHTGLAIPSCP